MHSKFCLHWNFILLKTIYIENFLYWKIICIENFACIKKKLLKNCFTYKNVVFKIILGTWCKIDVWELSFSFRKKTMNDYIIRIIETKNLI
jgi:hypothetical protein